MAGDQTAAVVPDDGEPVKLEQFNNPPDCCDVPIDGQGRPGIEPARACAGEVDDVARHFATQAWQELSKGRPADRPSVDEQDIRPLAYTTVGNFTGTDIEERVGRTTEEVGGLGERERGHETSVESCGPREPCGLVSLVAVITT
jgi:hypothetical protein